MAIAVAGCGPRQQTRPAPSQAPVAPAPGQPEPARSVQLRSAVETARDLFNRGENDLACEQVARALELQRRSTAAAPAELNAFRQACNPQ